MSTFDEILAEESVSAADVLTQRLAANATYRQFWSRTALARAVANRVIGYRADHGLSQRELAKRLGVHQPQIARLEEGDRLPSLDTLVKLAELGIAFRIEIQPATSDLNGQAIVEETVTSTGTRIRLAAT